MHSPGPTPIPEGSILLHVGMSKTGTTAIQSVLAQSRSELPAHGVLYPTEEPAHHLYARAVLGLGSGWRRKKAATDPRAWDELVETVHTNPSHRCVISSERLAMADQAQCERIASDLGPDRLHIIISARQLALTAASFWQQTMKTGSVTGMDDWFHRHFERTEAKPTPRFWRLKDPSVVAERWVKVVGAERVHVLVVDENDRTHVPRTFERLLDLPAGMLATVPVPTSNRSMTMQEAEFARLTNAALRERLRWPEYESLVRLGTFSRLVEVRDPAPEESRLQIPGWVAEQAEREGRRVAETLTDLGVDVIGDLANLTAPLSPERVRRDLAEPPRGVPMDLAVEAAVGPVLAAIQEMRRMQSRLKRARREAAEHPSVNDLTTTQLAAELRKRVGAGVRRRVRAHRSKGR